MRISTRTHARRFWLIAGLLLTGASLGVPALSAQTPSPGTISRPGLALPLEPVAARLGVTAAELRAAIAAASAELGHGHSQGASPAPSPLSCAAQVATPGQALPGASTPGVPAQGVPAPAISAAISAEGVPGGPYSCFSLACAMPAGTSGPPLQIAIAAPLSSSGAAGVMIDSPQQVGLPAVVSDGSHGVATECVATPPQATSGGYPSPAKPAGQGPTAGVLLDDRFFAAIARYLGRGITGAQVEAAFEAQQPAG